MKKYNDFDRMKAALDASIGIESEVRELTVPTGYVTLVYLSPTGVELLHVDVSGWGECWRIGGHWQDIPPVQKALQRSGEEVKA